MMSAAVSTSRATSRNSKDKTKVTAHHTQNKTDGPSSKVQPTEEQMRIAQIIPDQDNGELAAINQLMEMTGKSQDTVAVALHDCENDLERAALMLLEQGQTDEPQGDWKVEQSKKKKRTTNASVPIPKTDTASNHVSERPDTKRDRDRSRDDDRPDSKHDVPPRRGRRNGGPPPRMARGRGRDRNNQFGERNADGDHRDRGQEGDGFRDHDQFHDKENGFGRERSGERGRGRGRGNRGFSGRGGRGRGGSGGSGAPGGPGGPGASAGGMGVGTGGIGPGPGGMGSAPISGGGGGTGFKPEGRPRRFEKGPQIDTWTNETAENANKEPAGWGETWESTAPAEDVWSEDTWQGSLADTKVFTASTVKEEPLVDLTSSMSQSNSLGQSVSLTSSLGQPSSLRQPGSIGSAGGLGPAPGMGQSSTLGQRLDLGSLLKTAEQQQQANDNLIAQFNQQATESIKNTIGIGSSSRGNLSNLPTHSAASGMNSYSQTMQQGGMSPQSLSAQQLSHVQQGLHQRSKPQRSKLPPPSKIPASAVEMPGHVMPQLDVQFGVDFGTDSSAFGFSSSEPQVTASGFTTTAHSSAVSMNNHLGQVSNTSDSVMSGMSSPGKQQAPMGGLDHSPRTSVFQNTGYSPTTPKKDGSSLTQSSKMTPPDPIPFPPSQSDLKSSQLMGGQRQGQTSASLAQGSLSAVKTDSSGLSSFVQSTGNYQGSSYQGHKTSGLSSSQTYTHTTNSQGSSFQAQFQANQNQYQSGQNQYSTGSSQFQTGSSQYPSYPSGAASFQSQPNYTSSQANQNSSLYPTSTQTSSYQAQQTGSAYQLRDSQPSSARQASTNSSNSYQNQVSNLSSPPSQTQSSSVSGYSSKSYSSSGHQSSLQTSPLTANKLGDSLSNMSIKDSLTDPNQASQFDHTSTTAASLPTTTSTTSLTSISTTASTTASSATSGSARTSLPSTTKAPPNLPPGVPLVGHQYIVGQSPMAPFYVGNPSQNIQQPLYPGYEDVQLLQQRLPLANSYYDMSGFPVPSTIGGQDRATLGSVPYSGSTDTNKLNRVDAQSPNPTSQQQSTQSSHHPFINLQYGYYYPSMMHGTATGFQYPAMFPMPPVTNTAHAGTTATPQFPKSYASHGYNATKGYDDLNPTPDFTKTGYGTSQTQAKGSVGTRTGTADLATAAYSKSHTQGFDKQPYHGGTPPPFNLPMATQAGAMGAPTTPYGAAPFVPLMPHQAHSQMLHHPLQQDSSGVSTRAQQATSQAKAGGTKPFTTPYWGSN